jgi:uncharacterized protein
MEPRISLVTLGVKDLEASLRFYADGLGWTPSFRNEEVAFFQFPSHVFGLWRRDRMAAALGQGAETLGPGGIELAHNVRRREQVDEAVDAAVRAGATLRVPPHDAPWGGYTAHVADPDGYRWEIAWNPAWRIDDAGGVHLDNV